MLNTPTTPAPTEKKTDVKEALRDSHGTELHPGDTVDLRGIVTSVSGDKLEVAVNEGTEQEHKFAVPSSNVKQVIGQRIGAAPKLRQAVVEIPNPLGGVKIVPADLAAKGEEPRTQEINNVNPVAKRAEDQDDKTKTPATPAVK